MIPVTSSIFGAVVQGPFFGLIGIKLEN